MAVFVIHPCLPFCWSSCTQRGLFAPRALPRCTATAGLSATLSPSTAFPVSPVIQFPVPWFFSTGRGGLLQLLNVSLSSCRRYRPARTSRRLSQSATIRVAFTPEQWVRLLDLRFSRSPMRSLALQPHDLLTIPWMALSIDFMRFVSSTHAILATGF